MAALAATAWAVLFTIPSLYWALGGTFAIETITEDLDAFEESLGGLSLETALWVTAVLKLVGAALAASFLVDGLPARRPRFVGVLGAGVVTLLYGLANPVQHGGYALGLFEGELGIGEGATRRHALFWDPWWIVGGVLFLLTARSASRR